MQLTTAPTYHHFPPNGKRKPEDKYDISRYNQMCVSRQVQVHRHVGVQIYMQVCMYIYNYVQVYMYIYNYVQVCMYIYIIMCRCVGIYIRLVGMSIYVHVCMYVFMNNIHLLILDMDIQQSLQLIGQNNELESRYVYIHVPNYLSIYLSVHLFFCPFILGEYFTSSKLHCVINMGSSGSVCCCCRLSKEREST